MHHLHECNDDGAGSTQLDSSDNADMVPVSGLAKDWSDIH